MSVRKLLMIKMKVGKEEGKIEKRVKVREGRDERVTKSGGEEVR